MLLSLLVKDFVIVDSIALDFSPGFTVLTGETGAGKSILLDALGLLLGDRAEGSLVREGATDCSMAQVKSRLPRHLGDLFADPPQVVDYYDLLMGCSLAPVCHAH